MVQKKWLVEPHDWYAPITVLPHSMDTLICITRVETEGFQSLVRFFHKHRSLCLLYCYLLIEMRVKIILLVLHKYFNELVSITKPVIVHDPLLHYFSSTLVSSLKDPLHQYNLTWDDKLKLLVIRHFTSQNIVGKENSKYWWVKATPSSHTIVCWNVIFNIRHILCKDISSFPN